MKEEMCASATNPYLVQLPTNKIEVKLENSRMFMYGSLVCFTKDDFKEIIFGRIVDRNLELLREGRIVVDVESSKGNVQLNTDYLMIECKVFFEPYFYVLKALQRTYQYSFPMKKFIVDIDTNMDKPKYLVDQNDLNSGLTFR